MGNCCSPASSMEWGGEDWGSLKSKSTSSKVFDESGHQGNVEKEKLFDALRASSDANGKVKMTISKKELVELLGGGSIGIEKQQQQHMIKEQVGQISTCAEQVLFRLIKAREDAKQHHDSHHRPWRPVLQTIPEVN